MSPAQQLAIQGHAFLQETAGETVTVRGFTPTVLIERSPKLRMEPQDQGSINFEPAQESTVEVPVDSIGFIPKVGDVLIDDYGMAHRVRSVENEGITWFLHCKVTVPDVIVSPL